MKKRKIGPKKGQYRVVKAAASKPNKLFPGKPNYVGPESGWFGLVHHQTLFEHSYCISERPKYIRRHKPKAEVRTRLNHLIYLGPTLNRKISGHTGSICRQDDPALKDPVIKYLKRHVSPYRWDGHSLAYANGTRFTG